MRKKLKKLIICLVLFITLIAVIVGTPKKQAEASDAVTLTGNVKIQINYYSEFDYASNSGTEKTEFNAGDTFYIEIKLGMKTSDKVTSFQVTWDCTSALSNISSYTCLVGNPDDADYEGIMNDSSEDEMGEYVDGGYIFDVTSNGGPMDGTSNSTIALAVSDSSSMKTSTTGALKTIYLAKVTLSSGASNFSMDCTDCQINGSDYTSNVPSMSFEIASAASATTAMDTVTVKGSSESTARTISAQSDGVTYETTIPYDSTTATLTLTATNSGSIYSCYEGSTSKGTSSPYTINFSARGESHEYKVVLVTSNQASYSDTYTIKITREYCPTAELTNLTFAANDSNYTELSPSFATATKSYTLTYSSLATSIDVTPTWDTSTNATVTVNGTTATSGSAITISSLSDGGKITVVVSPEDPDTSDVTYTITLDEFTEDLSVTSVKVYDASGTLLTTLTSTSYDSTRGYTYYSYEVDYETAKTAVYYVVVLSDSTNNGVTYSPTGSSQSGNIYSESGTYPYGKDTYYIP